MIFTRLFGDSFFFTLEVTRSVIFSGGVTHVVGATGRSRRWPTVVVATVLGVPALGRLVSGLERRGDRSLPLAAVAVEHGEALAVGSRSRPAC